MSPSYAFAGSLFMVVALSSAGKSPLVNALRGDNPVALYFRLACGIAGVRRV